eukprot:gene2825-5551_t
MKYNFQPLVLILLFSYTGADELDIDLDGESYGTSSPSDDAVKANFHNNYAFSIDIHFDNGESKAYLGSIDQNSAISMNTYHGHTFHALRTDDSSKKILSTVRVTLGTVDYFFFGSGNDIIMKGPWEGSTYQIGTEIRDRLHPAVKLIGGAPTTAMNARFRSLSSRTLDLWYNDGKGGLPQGTLKPGQDSTTNAYEGHVFFYTPQGNKSHSLGSFTMNKNQVFYLLQDPEYPGSPEVLNYTAAEQQFMDEYLETNGIPWRCFYGRDGPRAPPKLHMWPADRIGQVHYVNSSQGKWSCNGPASECQSQEKVQLEIEVISRKPRAFVISNFLSDTEVNDILRLATPKIKQSTVGNSDGGGVRTSDTRTSANTWVARQSSPITETIYLRAADALNIHEEMLNSYTNAEEMQVVHYAVGQKYDAHHDWGVNGYAETRYITLLLYLNDMKHPNAGGETSFPKAAGGRGVKVHPGKGSAVLFYNLLEDGNCDDLSLHEATPVRDGEKWLANFWVWDPKRK